MTVDMLSATLEAGIPLQWRHNGNDSVSNHQPHDCLLNHLFRRRSKKTSKLRVTGLCAGNSPGTGEFPAQMASNAENASIWWRHHTYVTNRSVLRYSPHVHFYPTVEISVREIVYIIKIGSWPRHYIKAIIVLSIDTQTQTYRKQWSVIAI